MIRMIPIEIHRHRDFRREAVDRAVTLVDLRHQPVVRARRAPAAAPLVETVRPACIQPENSPRATRSPASPSSSSCHAIRTPPPTGTRAPPPPAIRRGAPRDPALPGRLPASGCVGGIADEYTTRSHASGRPPRAVTLTPARRERLRHRVRQSVIFARHGEATPCRYIASGPSPMPPTPTACTAATVRPNKAGGGDVSCGRRPPRRERFRTRRTPQCFQIVRHHLTRITPFVCGQRRSSLLQLFRIADPAQHLGGQTGKVLVCGQTMPPPCRRQTRPRWPPDGCRPRMDTAPGPPASGSASVRRSCPRRTVTRPGPPPTTGWPCDHRTG
jgi:hypothetical protein